MKIRNIKNNVKNAYYVFEEKQKILAKYKLFIVTNGSKGGMKKNFYLPYYYYYRGTMGWTFPRVLRRSGSALRCFGAILRCLGGSDADRRHFLQDISRWHQNILRRIPNVLRRAETSSPQFPYSSSSMAGRNFFSCHPCCHLLR